MPARLQSRAPNEDRALAGSETGWSQTAALWMLVVLIAGTLAYPDTFVDAGFRAGPFRISPIGLLFAITAPLIFWRFWSACKLMLSATAVDLTLVAFMAFITVRGLAAATNGNELALVVAFSSYVVLVYYGVATVAQAQKAPRILFLTIVVMGIVAAVFGLVEFLLERNVLYESIIKEAARPFPGKGYHRSGSLLGQPVAMGAFMVQTIPFILFFFINSRTRKAQAGWGAATILVVLALLVTFSKGAWITAAILLGLGLASLLLRRPRATRPLLLLFAASVAVTGLFTAGFYSTVQAGTLSKARTRESIAPRTYMWSRAPATFRANPLIGAGLWQGNAEVFRVNPAPEATNRPTVMDNIYLTLLVEQGAIGMLLSLSTLLLLGRQAVNLLRRGGSHALWAWPPAICMLATLINGFTFDSLIIWPIMVVFWLSAGMLRALAERTSQDTAGS